MKVRCCFELGEFEDDLLQIQHIDGLFQGRVVTAASFSVQPRNCSSFEFCFLLLSAFGSICTMLKKQGLD
jgi:hypothetical protein